MAQVPAGSPTEVWVVVRPGDQFWFRPISDTSEIVATLARLPDAQAFRAELKYKKKATASPAVVNEEDVTP